MSCIKPHSRPNGFSPTLLFSLPCGKHWWCFCFSSCASDIQQSWTSLTSLQFSSSPPGMYYVLMFLCFSFSEAASHGSVLELTTVWCIDISGCRTRKTKGLMCITRSQIVFEEQVQIYTCDGDASLSWLIMSQPPWLTAPVKSVPFGTDVFHFVVFTLVCQKRMHKMWFYLTSPAGAVF